MRGRTISTATFMLALGFAAAAHAKWKLANDADFQLRGNGSSRLLLAPTNVVVSFTLVPGFSTPADFPVTMALGQDAILDVTYGPAVVEAPVLFFSSTNGLRVSGTAGATVRLQFREALVAGDWSDVPGKVFTLGAGPVTVLTAAEGAAAPGFYRALITP